MGRLELFWLKFHIIKEKSHSSWTNGHSKHVGRAGEEDPDVLHVHKAEPSPRNAECHPKQFTKPTSGRGKVGRGPTSGAPMRASMDGHHQ